MTDRRFDIFMGIRERNEHFSSGSGSGAGEKQQTALKSARHVEICSAEDPPRHVGSDPPPTVASAAAAGGGWVPPREGGRRRSDNYEREVHRATTASAGGWRRRRRVARGGVEVISPGRGGGRTLWVGSRSRNETARDLFGRGPLVKVVGPLAPQKVRKQRGKGPFAFSTNHLFT
ncbi:hypothetical protein NL676_023467 [Syzygium grande]|nr:hypothetical protein NL676_023467 [Syzygium grande]